MLVTIVSALVAPTTAQGSSMYMSQLLDTAVTPWHVLTDRNAPRYATRIYCQMFNLASPGGEKRARRSAIVVQPSYVSITASINTIYVLHRQGVCFVYRSTRVMNVTKG